MNEEINLRLIALSNAIEIGRNRFKNSAVDEDEIVKIAEKFLAFLQDEPAPTKEPKA